MARKVEGSCRVGRVVVGDYDISGGVGGAATKLETLSPETPSTIVPVALTWRGPGVRFHGLKYYIIIYSQ